jgi:hypothetical protein
MLAKLRSGVNDHQGLPVSTLKFYFPGHILTDQSEMYPSEIFVDLESGLASHKAKGPAGKNEASTGTKRTYDQSTSGPSSAPESKQSRVSVFENGGSVLGPTPSTPAASTSTRSDLDMPSLSTLSKNQTEQINAFRKKQDYLTAVSSYTVTCPMIEEQFPALAGQLKLDLTLHRDWKESNGMLVAGFDFGLEP